MTRPESLTHRRSFIFGKWADNSHRFLRSHEDFAIGQIELRIDKYGGQ